MKSSARDGASRCRSYVVPATSLAALMLSGCATLQAQSRVDPRTVAIYQKDELQSRGQSASQSAQSSCGSRLKGDNQGGAINLNCYRFPDDAEDGTTAYSKAVSSDDAEVARASRNRLSSLLIKQSDDICTVELGTLTANEATVNTTLSVLTTGFASAATIVTGDIAQRVLAGLAGLSSGARGHINAEIYRSTLSPVLARAIKAERVTLEQAIVAKYSESTVTYSADQMIKEVNQYHHTCSFFYGLSLVIKAVDRVALEREDRGRYISLSLDDIRLRAALVRQQRAAAGSSDAEKASLDAQLKQFIELETKLVTERAALTSPALPK